jgi:hypothetical protein
MHTRHGTTARVLALLGMALLAGCVEVPSVGLESPEPIGANETEPVAPSSPYFPTDTSQGDAVSGMIIDQTGAGIPGAVIRQQATENSTTSHADGSFVLDGLPAGQEVTISAWAEGYYCANATDVVPPAEDLALVLRTVQTDDNPDYVWVPPLGENSCYSCKPAVTQVWLDNDAHSLSATNPRFLTMYNGTAILGNQSPSTSYGYTRDYGRFPLGPDPDQPYYGPGYRLDFPETAGNCAACHTPGPAVDAPYGVDPNRVAGVDTFGVHCDFCHKIADVTLNPATGLPYPNMPGVLSMDLRRPFPDDPERYQLFFGTFDDDNVPMEDTYLPLLSQSQFCAPCHFGVFWDIVVYNSYGEWLESPYGDPSYEGARTCQECHMPSPTLLDGEALTNVAPDAGGIERDPSDIHAHTFPGAANEALLQNSVTMTMEADLLGGELAVAVRIANDQTGHHIPTDSPLRQMILLVEARTSSGAILPLLEGPTVPLWGGVGDPSDGYYAGLPGTAYARVLQELWTEVAPTGAYWNPTRVLSDNRIPAMGSDTTRFAFDASNAGRPLTVTARLLFRRAFIQLMDWKGWDVQDILMEENSIELP